MYADKGDAVGTVVRYARLMPQHNDNTFAEIIRSRYTFDKFDQEATKKYAALLCKPENLNIFLSSKSFEGKTDKEDQWFLTKYSIEKFADQLTEMITKPKVNEKSKALGLPPPNTLIPQNFDVDEGLPGSPVELRPGVWFKKDDKFKRPKAIIKMKLYSTDCLYGLKPEARVFTTLFIKMQQEFLREYLYMAE
jgi:insulysin